jgi:excisionase family DNA binding protein
MTIHTPIPSTEAEALQIRELSRLLDLGTPSLLGSDGKCMELPVTVFLLLKDIARNMQLGQSMLVLPDHQPISTQEAADFLGVSRPHLVKLMESGKLPHHKAGTHRRIYLKDLVAYQARRNEQRHAALNNLAKEAFDSGLYDRSAIPEGGRDE